MIIHGIFYMTGKVSDNSWNFYMTGKVSNDHSRNIFTRLVNW